MKRPAYLAKKFANKYQVIEHHSQEQICQTQTIDWAHKIASFLNDEETAKHAKTELPPFTVSDGK